MFLTGLLLALLLMAAWFSRRCGFRVEEGQLGLLSTFGAAQREGPALKTFPPGLHGKWPWQQVTRVSMREQALVLSGEKGQHVMAEDGTVLRLDASVRYVPEVAGLEHFVFGLKSPLEHINGLFTCLLRNEIANLAKPAAPASTALAAELDDASGSYGLIRRERSLLNQRIAAASRERLGERYGVRFLAVDLMDILPPDELADALNAVMNARSEADSQRFRAESESRQQLLAAQQGVDIARTHASAVQLEMDTLAEHLGTLERDGVLELYVERRQAEVLSESRTVYVNETGGVR